MQIARVLKQVEGGACSALLVMLLGTGGAAASDSYRFRETFEGWPSTEVSSGVVVAGESAYRVELDPSDDPRPHDAIVSKDGEHEIALHRELRTFYDLTASRPTSRVTSYLFRLLPAGEASAGQVTLRVDDTAGEPLEGHATRKIGVDLAYTVDVDLGVESISGRVEARATFWMTEEISLALPVHLRPGFQTGFPEIDAAVSEALARLRGFPLKQELQITTKSADAPSSTERFEIVIDSFKASDCNAACFQVPDIFVLREPLFSKPGELSRVVPAVPDE